MPSSQYVPSSTLGASFFEWDGGNVYRVVSFLNFVSDAHFSAATADQSRTAIETASGLPSWPAAGAVAPMGDVVVIKLSEPTAMQLSRFSLSRGG